MVITISIKSVIMCILNRCNFTGFYRNNPATVNVASVALECWHFFLAIPLVISRAAILIFTALFFIGRVDRPVLAEDLGEYTCLSPTPHYKFILEIS